MRSALNPTYGDLDTNATILNQRLRSLGAWNCPNHFKSSSYAFSRVGDFLGYHCLVTKELVDSLIRSSTNQAQPNLFSGTLLHQLVMNKDSRSFQLLRGYLKTQMTAIYATSKAAAPHTLTRSAITTQLLQDRNVNGQLTALQGTFANVKNTDFWWWMLGR